MVHHLQDTNATHQSQKPSYKSPHFSCTPSPQPLKKSIQAKWDPLVTLCADRLERTREGHGCFRDSSGGSWRGFRENREKIIGKSSFGPPLNWGFPKGGFYEGGEISIIGVVRAPVAIINFAFFVWQLLVESYISSGIFRGS